MSFGFSVGDFLTAASLIRDTVSSLRNSATSSYHELVLELHGLQRALSEIERLQCPPSQQAAVNGVKLAALMCQHPLDEFAGKLKKFERLGGDNGDKIGKIDTLKIWGRKVQWGFSMEEEIAKLRAYLVAHVGSLNMRLITLGLTTSTITGQRNDEAQLILQMRADDAQTAISETRKSVEKHGALTRCNNSILRQLKGIISGEISSHLKVLIDLAGKIWQSNIQIMTIMVKLQANSPSPELRYTWVQEPVRFEDALGRIIPIPSEYNWGKLEAVILDQFSIGAGNEKVASGEYELFNSFDSSQLLSKSEFEALTPGMSIIMAIIVGKYGGRTLERCPRIGCRSVRISPNESGGKTCSVCKAWFDLSQKPLPKPLRPSDLDGSSFIYAQPRKPWEIISPQNQILRLEMQDRYKQMRNEGRGFKNVRVHFSELPKTPSVSNVRGLHTRSQKGKRKRESAEEWTPRKARSLHLSKQCAPTRSMPPPKMPALDLPRIGMSSLIRQGSSNLSTGMSHVTSSESRFTTYEESDVLMSEAVPLPDKPALHLTTLGQETSWLPHVAVVDEGLENSDCGITEGMNPSILHVLEVPTTDRSALGIAGIGAVSNCQRKAPSIITEPSWSAMSPAPSIWATQTAPSDLNESLNPWGPQLSVNN